MSATETLQQNLDFVWVLAAAALVFLMQMGFLLLEAGMVRSKNSINVAQKNVLDFMASGLAFGAVGCMIAFGRSASWAPIGWDNELFLLNGMTPWVAAFFVFQVMFCGTAATIVSGAVAERMKLFAYVLCAIALAAFIYPVFTHWAWGGALGDNSGTFLANMGYVDFAGSTVVHATGGWVALAACIVLGARLGRFGPDGEVRRMHGHNPVLAGAGALLLFVGWIGFNGGSTLAANQDIAHIIANTVLAGCAGGFVGYLFGWARDGVVLPDRAVNGCIAGLVAITAGCFVADAKGSVLIGAIGAVVALYANDMLERRFKLDDAVGAIGVHGFAGAAGTIALAVIAPLQNLPLEHRLPQLGVQALGVGINFVWAFGGGLAVFFLLDKLMGIRVSAEAENKGLNEAEHDTRLGIGHVEAAFGLLAAGDADLNMRLPVEPGDEAEQLTHIFNAMMDNLQAEENARGAEIENTRTNAESERLRALTNTTFEALCICGVDGNIGDGNAALSTLLGAPIENLKGRMISDFVAPEHHDVLENLQTQVDAAPHEITVIDMRGDEIPVEMRGRDINFRGIDTRVLAMIDLRERKQAERQIRFLAQHDPLTNLPNRALYNEKLQEMTERTAREGILSAVMLIDLDHFKDINDLHGHRAGDEVIKTVADRLRAAMRKNDMVARLGGDEFGVLQIDINFVNQAADLAHRLITELSRPIELSDGAHVRCGASIGVAICPRDGMEGPALIQRADTALYHSKNGGRNAFAIFEDGMDKEIRRRQLLEADLAQAIERDEMEVYYQPRLNALTGEIDSYEALVRWNHPKRGRVSPADFIPVAEHCGRIVAIGEWVMRTACSAAVAHMEGSRVSVNVSPLQFRERDFVEKVARILQETGLSSDRLEIEITESMLIDDDKRAIALLTELKALGVEIALDDFGTGYSSLGYLSRFPFDTLKIDRSFVSGLRDDANAPAIIETIIRLGSALDMTIVAEGVEEEEELRFLAEHGCHEIQGFLVGRPLPIAQVLRRAPEMVRRALRVDDIEGDDVIEAKAEVEAVSGDCEIVEDAPADIIALQTKDAPAQPAFDPQNLAPQERAVLALQRRIDGLLQSMPVQEAAPAKPAAPARPAPRKVG